MIKEKAILLIDMDAFYASCHSSIDNSLKDYPIVVASPNYKSIVTTSSYEARKFGIKSGMPVFMAKKLCPNLKIISPDFKLYIEISDAILKFVYDNFSKKIESVSIDEFFVDVTDEWKKFGSVKKMADEIRQGVQKKFNLTCSIGVSTNKFLSKMASEMNKPNGTFVLLRNNIDKFLHPLPVSKMYGVGKATEETLNKMNIYKIKDIYYCDENKLINALGKRGKTIYDYAHGIDSDVIKINKEDSKVLSNEMTLSNSTSNIREIEEFYYELSKMISYRLNKNYLVAKTIQIHFKYEYDYSYEGFDKRERIKHTSHRYTVAKHTNNLEDIFSIAMNLFFEIWNEKPIYLVGISVSNMITSVFQEKQISFDHDFKIPFVAKDINNIISKTNLLINKKILMTGSEYEKKIDKKFKKGGTGLMKMDNDRITEKQIKNNWKK